MTPQHKHTALVFVLTDNHHH